MTPLSRWLVAGLIIPNPMDDMLTHLFGRRDLFLCCSAFAALLFHTSVHADEVPKNLANGLYELVEDSQISPALQRSLVRKPTEGERVSKFALKDTQGRIMVDIHLDGTRSIAAVRSLVSSEKDVTFIAEDRAFQAGTIEAYMTPAAAANLAQQRGIAAFPRRDNTID